MEQVYVSERRQGGRIVDLRVVLDIPPRWPVMCLLESALRQGDAVFSIEGREVEIALASTSPQEAAATVVPRMRQALSGHDVAYHLH